MAILPRQALTAPPLTSRGFLLGVRIELWSAPSMVLILEADTIVDNARSRCIEAYRVSQNAKRKPLVRICGRTFLLKHHSGRVSSIRCLRFLDVGIAGSPIGSLIENCAGSGRNLLDAATSVSVSLFVHNLNGGKQATKTVRLFIGLLRQ